ncbi:MAG: helix-turn-helix transcriptional regulator [Aquisalinus sp.]|nr:helix-turn-helix transcriptional regulator [Aquisalinus sp.]
MDKYSEVNAAIALVYKAVMSPEHWPDVLSALSDILDADKAVFISGTKDAVLATGVQHNHDPERLEAYNTYYNRHDPWWGPLQKLAPGLAVRAQELKPVSEITHTEYYHDHLKKADIGGPLVATLDTMANRQSAISFQRTLARDDFSSEDAALLQMLVPHLVNAVQMNWQMTQHLVRESFLSTGTASGFVLIVDDRGCVLGPDTVADSLAARTSVLTITHDRLRAIHTNDQQQLDEALDSVVKHGIGKAFPLKDSGLNAPIIVRSCPIPAVAEARVAMTTGNLAVICIDIPVTPTLSGVYVMSETYGLSAKESDLLSSFSNSYNLRATADALDITYETARWHLKQILAKTGTHNQAELLVKTAEAAR